MSLYGGVLIQKFVLDVPMQNNAKFIRFELLMTPIIKDCCVMGCDIPTLQIVLTVN